MATTAQTATSAKLNPFAIQRGVGLANVSEAITESITNTATIEAIKIAQNRPRALRPRAVNRLFQSTMRPSRVIERNKNEYSTACKTPCDKSATHALACKCEATNLERN